MDLDDAQTGIEQEESAPQRILGPLGKVRWTSQDQKFLKALKISTDEHSD